MGGALTNRPFISKLSKIEFSLDSENIKLYREVKKMLDIERKPVKVEEVDDKKKEVKLDDVEVIKAKNIELEEKLRALEDKKEKKNADVKLEEFVEAQKIQLQAMEDRITKLTEANVALEEDNKKTKEVAKVSEIKLFCDRLLNDEKHHPSVVEVVRDLLLENPSDEKVYKFSETIGEGDEAKTRDINISLQGVISNILSAVPATQRANYTEKTTSDSVSLSEAEQNEMEDKAMSKAFAKKNLKRLTAVK